MGNHGAAGGISERRRSSHSSFITIDMKYAADYYDGLMRKSFSPIHWSYMRHNAIYTLGKKGCYTPIEDNKTNVDHTFVFPLG